MIMNLEDTKRLINKVIENEFAYIRDYQEDKDLLNDVEINQKGENTTAIIQKLISVASEHEKLIYDLESEVSAYWVEICRYYFKKGVMAGTTNLKFLEDTKIMEYI